MSETEVGSVKKRIGDLRVIDLRSELEKRGLDKSGVKTALLERLTKALKEAGENPAEYDFPSDKTPSKSTPKRSSRKFRGSDTETANEEEHIEASQPDEHTAQQGEEEQLEELVTEENQEYGEADQEMEEDQVLEEEQEMEEEQDGEEEVEEIEENQDLDEELSEFLGEEYETVEEDQVDENQNDENVSEEVDENQNEVDEENLGEEVDEENLGEEVDENQNEVDESKDEEVDDNQYEDAEESQMKEEEVEVNSVNENEDESDLQNEINTEDNKDVEVQEENLADADGEGIPAQCNGSRLDDVAELLSLSPPKPETAPVITPLTVEDVIKLDTSTKFKPGDNDSMIVHPDETQSDIDSSVNERDSNFGDAVLEEGSVENVDVSATSEDAVQENEETAVADEIEADLETAEGESVVNNVTESDSLNAETTTDVTSKPESTGKQTEKSVVADSTAKSAEKTDPKQSATAVASGEVVKRVITSGKNLWVSGLAEKTRANDLKVLFTAYGKVSGAKIVTNAKTPGSRCYGFITMSSSEEATLCVEKLYHTELHGKIITVEKTTREPTGSIKRTELKGIQSKTPTKTPDATGDKDKDTKSEKESAQKEKDKAKTEKSKPSDRAIKSKSQEKSRSSDKGKEDDKSKDRGSDKRDTKRRHSSKDSRDKSRDRRRSRDRRSRSRSRSKDRGQRFNNYRGKFSSRGFNSGRNFVSKPFNSFNNRFQNDRDRFSGDRDRFSGNRDSFSSDRSRDRFEDMDRQRDIERRNREESLRLEKERERLRLEREKLEQERAEVLRLEKEKQRMERENLERERLELRKRSQMTLDDRRPKRFESPRKDDFWDDRKRSRRESPEPIASFTRQALTDFSRGTFNDRTAGRGADRFESRPSRGDQSLTFNRGGRDTSRQDDSRGGNFRAIKEVSREEWKPVKSTRESRPTARNFVPDNRRLNPWESVKANPQEREQPKFETVPTLTTNANWGPINKGAENWGRIDQVPQQDRWVAIDRTVQPTMVPMQHQHQQPQIIYAPPATELMGAMPGHFPAVDRFGNPANMMRRF